jgi:hypothetical protein
MEELPHPPSPGPWQRPRLLARLCTASFIDQGVVFPIYLLGIAASAFVARMDPDAFHGLMESNYERFLEPEQREQMMAYADLLRTHGVALMSVFALRTLVRFIGTLRMWQGRRDGFHIYTMAQLLGCLLPILIAGPAMFSALGFLLVLSWCYFYFLLRKTLRP